MTDTITRGADAAPAGGSPDGRAPRPDPRAEARRIRRIAFSQRLSRWDFRLSPYLYISPFFILFAVTGLFPLLYTAVVSVHEWHLIGGQGDFVGLDNFAWVLGQDRFWLAMRNTFSIFLVSSVPQVIFALIIAAALDQNLRARTFWRMGVLLPYVVAPVAVSLIFTNMFGDQYGVVNNVLTSLGIEPIRWHADTLSSHLAIATMVNFRWTGYNALILLAAMQAIPRDYYEAAQIDGASKLRQFLSVTIPSLRPTLIFVIITSTIGGLQIFDEPRMFDQYGQGGASGQWMTITIYLYNLGWGQLDFGKAAAVAWLLFLLIVVFGILNYLISQRIASADAPRARRRKKEVAR
ncbi:carbohydrate ABC transporter permease [Homoserinibacter sp. YIM 151385]|uniref:carbohydrate ABC transporter permease n=1 Tax=Homoserinibacter sp. YIM 151385 TaxID=2985506 RepID=UPI0022F0DEEF|nr:sugar ABC transporter permease [Homoserinibacter sp. YIM 151385]WBU37120.1 sugar ABC transporter permease [Homoserinibacter sp. YIM 151385]